MIESRTFLLGEEKYIDFMVCSKDADETIVITDAKDKLIEHKTESIESEGVCQIDGRCLRVFLSPSHKGLYHLVVNVEIPPEKLKAYIDIVVKERD